MAEIPDYDVLPHCDWSSVETDYEIFTENLNIEYLKDSPQAKSMNQQRKELSKEEQEIVSKQLAELGYL